MCNASLTKHSDEQHIQRTVVVPDNTFDVAGRWLAANLSMRAVSKSPLRDRWLEGLVAAIEGKPDHEERRDQVSITRTGRAGKLLPRLMEACNPSRPCLKFLVRLWAFCCQKLNARRTVEDPGTKSEICCLPWPTLLP